MKAINSLKKINEYLNSSNFIDWLGYIFWLLIISSTSIFFIILCDIILRGNIIFSPTGESFNYAFELYKTPITLLASSIVILSLRVTFIRVGQTEKQLDATYKPELYINKGKLFSYTREAGPSSKFFIFTSKQGSFNELPIIKIYNVGLASAKDIKYSYSYDVSKAVDLLKELDSDEEFLLKYNEDSISFRTAKVANIISSKCYFYVENKEIYSNFLLPNSEGKIYDEIVLPIYYCMLFSLFLYLKINPLISNKEVTIEKRTLEPIDLNDFPSLMCKISYKDLGNKEISKTFKIDLDFTWFKFPIKNGSLVDSDNWFFINPTDVTSQS